MSGSTGRWCWEGLAIYVRDDCVLDADRCYIDTPKLDLIGRLHGSGWYSRVTDRLSCLGFRWTNGRRGRRRRRSRVCGLVNLACLWLDRDLTRAVVTPEWLCGERLVLVRGSRPGRPSAAAASPGDRDHYRDDPESPDSFNIPSFQHGKRIRPLVGLGLKLAW